jgi:hypothetical protein
MGAMVDMAATVISADSERMWADLADTSLAVGISEVAVILAEVATSAVECMHQAVADITDKFLPEVSRSIVADPICVRARADVGVSAIFQGSPREYRVNKPVHLHLNGMENLSIRVLLEQKLDSPI